MGEHTIGVEEEFHVVDPATGRVVGDAERIAGGTLELLTGTVETATPVVDGLADLRAALVDGRRRLAAAAADAGLVIASSGSLPLVDWASLGVPADARYRRLADDYGRQAREQLICGTHTHVTVADPDQAVRAMTRARPWLPTLLALSASSPYWDGDDTDFASWRTQLWRRWPLGGDPPPLAGRAEYDALLATLLAADTLPDEGMLYFDLRPSSKYPTLEFRVPDACQRVDEAVLTAALARALVTTAVREDADGAALPEVHPTLLAVARFRAARYGLDGPHLDPLTGRAEPARAAVDRLLAHVGGALADAGEADAVHALVDRVLQRGTGAARQRAAVARAGGDVRAAVDLVLAETAGP